MNRTEGACRSVRDAAISAEVYGRILPGITEGVTALLQPVPRGRTGKRLEVPVKRILQGAEPMSALGPVEVAQETIAELTKMAHERRRERDHVQA